MKQARVMPKPDSKQHGEPVKQTKMANESVPSLLDPADVGWIQSSTSTEFPPEDELVNYHLQGKMKHFPLWVRCVVTGTGVFAVIAFLYFTHKRQVPTV